MKKIGDLLQGQVPPNQTPSKEADEKAAVKQYHIDRANTKPDYSKASSTADLVARAMAAGARAAALEKEKASKTVVQLPLWPDAVRGIPNSVLRSALFGAIKRGRRAFLQGEKIASIDGIDILQTGPRLDQADLDVWEQCLHLAREQALGTRIHFSAYGFLKAIGRTYGGKNVEWLKNALRRLSASVVEIKSGKHAYFGPMLHHGARDDETGQYVIEINPAIIHIYGTDGWTAEQWSERMVLKGQPLAQWLHGFYSTHVAPHSYKVETLHRLCGSETKQQFHFRAELRQALDALADVSGWDWRIDEKDLVHIEKTPTPSQVRHLISQRGRLKKPK
jgi:hypothetical protein